MRFTILLIIFLALAAIVSAQPGCNSIFDPSVTCGRQYNGVEFIFVGKVIDVERKIDLWRDPPKVRVAVETSIKGELGSEIEVYVVDRECFMMSSPFPGQKYLFSAGSAKYGDMSRLFVHSWSLRLEAYSTEEIAEFVTEIQSVLRGDRQPSIIGRVIESFGEKAYRSMQATPLNMKLGYNPHYARPMAGVVITAIRKDGVEHRTTSNENGEYKFEDLPPGIYEVKPEVSVSLFVEGYGDYNRVEDHKKLIEIDDNICSKRFNFFVEETIIKTKRFYPAEVFALTESLVLRSCR